MKSNGRAREFGETEGFIKVVVEAETDRILGAAVLATEGPELIHMLRGPDECRRAVYSDSRCHPYSSDPGRSGSERADVLWVGRPSRRNNFSEPYPPLASDASG